MSGCTGGVGLDSDGEGKEGNSGTAREGGSLAGFGGRSEVGFWLFSWPGSGLLAVKSGKEGGSIEVGGESLSRGLRDSDSCRLPVLAISGREGEALLSLEDEEEEGGLGSSDFVVPVAVWGEEEASHFHRVMRPPIKSKRSEERRVGKEC